MVKDMELVERNLAEMSKALTGADPDLVENFLFSLLTPSEADEIAKRWALVKEIAKGTPQREIAKDLGLSLCKITRGSRELKKEASPFRRMLLLAGVEVPDNIGARRSLRGAALRVPARPARAGVEAAAEASAQGS
jgi:TrpR family trp operon transcriptional repressor